MTTFFPADGRNPRPDPDDTTAHEKRLMADGFALADTARESFESTLEALAWVCGEWRAPRSRDDDMVAVTAEAALLERATGSECVLWARFKRDGLRTVEDMRWFMDVDAERVLRAMRRAA